jgi:hypothetical protein
LKSPCAWTFQAAVLQASDDDSIGKRHGANRNRPQQGHPSFEHHIASSSETQCGNSRVYYTMKTSPNGDFSKKIAPW